MTSCGDVQAKRQKKDDDTSSSIDDEQANGGQVLSLITSGIVEGKNELEAKEGVNHNDGPTQEGSTGGVQMVGPNSITTPEFLAGFWANDLPEHWNSEAQARMKKEFEEKLRQRVLDVEKKVEENEQLQMLIRAKEQSENESLG